MMETIWGIISSTTPYLLSLLAFLICLEQITYFKKKSSIPGPSLILPFFGNAISLVRNPTLFWEVQSAFAKSSHHGVSANYIIGNFIVFIRSSDLSHKIFSNVRPDAFRLVGHPFGKKLFGEHNLIYMMGQDHKDLRRRIAPNFTPRALSTYTNLQQSIILKHLASWLDVAKSKSPESIPLRILSRDMNLETSQKVFVGPYLTSESRERFNYDYNFFNVGLMKLPIDLPGFAFRNARLAVSRLVETLGGCAEESKVKMKAGEEPTCLIDFWMQDTLREIAAAEDAGEPTPPHSGSIEIGGHLFDFLFASQDASTSSLLWAVTLLDSHPEVLDRVRREVAGIWSPESDKLITAEQLREMKYTEAVAKEVIRIRAPATLVPHIAAEDFMLTADYTIPRELLFSHPSTSLRFKASLNRTGSTRTGLCQRGKRIRFTKRTFWRLVLGPTSVWARGTPSITWSYSSPCSQPWLISRGTERTAVMISIMSQPFAPRTIAEFFFPKGALDFLLSNDEVTPSVEFFLLVEIVIIFIC